MRNKFFVACFFILIVEEAVGSDFMDNYILKHYPSSSVNQLRAYSCEDLNSMCNWVEYKDAVLDKNCEKLYSKDSLKRTACLKVIENKNIFFQTGSKNTKREYKYSCDGIYQNKADRSVCKNIMSVFSYCESLIVYNYEVDFPACHQVIRDRKAFSKTGCKKLYRGADPSVRYLCIDLFDNGRATGSRSRRGLNAAYKVYCNDITKRKENEIEIYSKEFSCKMQTFWSNEGSTLCEKNYKNTCFSKAANVW